MKKNYFLLLCSVLLSVSFLGTACSKDDAEPVVVAPTFPELVTKTASAGEVIDLSFDANYDWVASISESTYTYFQLLTGEGANATTTKSISGAAGKHTIQVKVAEDVVYENAPVAEVTLSMNGESKVIAKVTYPVTERNVAIYAPIVNDWGAFKSGVYGGEYLYSYEESAMAADANIVMAWGVERGNSDATDTFFAPVMIETNFDYTVAGPEWMVAAEAGVIGKQEHIIKADAAKIPADAAVETINILAAGSETVVASFNVKITGANDFVPQLGFALESEYAYDGKAINGGVTGSFVAGNYVKVVCDATGAAAEWLTVSEEADETESVIKNYNVTATAAANDSAAARTAYVFYFAKNAAPADNASLFENGEVKEEYAESLATVVNQYTQPATIKVNGWLDDTCTTFAEAGSDINYWFTEGALYDLHIGTKYDISYFGEWAEYGSDNSFVTSKPVASFKTYAYTLEGSFVELTEDPWAWGESFYDDEELTRFKIYTNLNASTAEGAQNWLNGDYEAVILVEYTDGTYSAIYFHYSSQASAGGDDITEVAFVDPAVAAMYGATLVQLTEADTELFLPDAVDMNGNVIPQYHLTYKYAGTVLPLTVPSYDFAYPQAEWIMYEGTNTELYIGMMTEEPAMSVLNFYKNNVVSVRIVCEFAPMTEGGDEGGNDDEGGSVETIDWDYVCGAYAVSEWDNPWWHADATRRYQLMGHGFWHNYVKLASDCKVDGVPCGTPKDGQRYGVVYSWNNHAFFNIASTEIDPETWEPKSGTGCYALTDLIDRENDTDKVIDNKSYYNKTEEAFYFSFTLTSGGTVYRHCGKLHSRGSVAEK